MPAVPLALAAVADVGILAHCRILAALGIVEPITVNVVVLLHLRFFRL